MKRSKKGLSNGRIDWQGEAAEPNIICYALAQRGFSAKAIGRATGLSRGQVYNRCKSLGIKITDYRNGVSGHSLMIIQKYTTLSPSQEKALKREVNRYFVKEKEL